MDFEERFDVLIAGGGIAGTAAALEAARAGLRTALVEKTVFLGGLATTGLINVYLPLCDGNGTQVTFGIAEELLHLSLRYGPGQIPSNWRRERNAGEPQRYCATFNPASFILALDEAAADAGVELWLDTLICGPIMDGRRVAGVEVENKSGRGQFLADCVIDATGDADVAYRAGAECVESGNWLSFWAIIASLDQARGAIAHNSGAGLLELLQLGAAPDGAGQPTDVPKLLGTDAHQVTRFILEGRKLLLEHYRARQLFGGDASRHDGFPIALPAMAQFRTTRRVVGKTTLHGGEDGKSRDDSIGLVADWRRAGRVWEIPYGALVPEMIQGLLLAGRCISSEGDAWEVTRVIPPAALTGQAAGLAATMAVKQHAAPHELDVEAVQEKLRQKGIPTRLAEVGLGTDAAQ